MNSSESIKACLGTMALLNRPLADELEKLPEIRRFGDSSSRRALANLVAIYRFAPRRFDRMFMRMNRIGLTARRDYCSPLQALFWLVYDEELEAVGALLGILVERATDGEGHCRPRRVSGPDPLSPDGAGPDYTLDKMLDVAWSREPELISGPEIHNIINGIWPVEESDEYALLVGRHDDRQLQGYIMDDFLRKKEIFNARHRNTLRGAVRRSRWKRFYTVADRLNAPELVSYYMNRYFSFRKTPASGVYFTFFNNKAQCTDAAYFARFMLDRAGYQTFMRSVKWDEDPWDGLHTGAGVVLDAGLYLLVANYTGINAMSGPFSDLESLDRKLSCGRKIIDSQWGAYYPPCYF